MKFLQDLVPGCSKLTGKAVMLDEIINYVQSLQRQVEFLSMKMAAVNSRLDFNMDSLFRKDIFHSQASLQQPFMFSAEKVPPYMQSKNRQNSHAFRRFKDHGTIARSLIHALPLGGPDPSFLGTLNASAPISKEAFSNNVSQAPLTWDNELQILVQTSFDQSRQTCLTSTIVQGEEACKSEPLKPET